MIEAPEALLLAGQLNETLGGRRVADVIVRYTPHKFAWFYGDPDAYGAMLSGKAFIDARAYGGHVELCFGEVRLLFTDGVNLRYVEPGGKLPATHQLLVGFDDQSCLVASVRMYGGLFCHAGGEIDGPFEPYCRAARSKPQVMSGEFDRSYFRSLIDAGDAARKSAKAFLATGQTVPGLGNGVLQDILFRAGIHPKTPVGVLSEVQRDTLFDSVRETLDEIYRLGGRDTETDLFGRRGGYVSVLSKNTVGTPCPRCGATICKESYLGGSIYYCPDCQPWVKIGK